MFERLKYVHRYNYSRFWSHRPIILAHSITSRCNCRCKICDVWRKTGDATDLSTLEIFRMLDEAEEQNFVAYLAWGGEPLLRADSLDILKHAHDLGLYTSFVTNGILLSEKASKIAKIVDLTWVSLDHFTDYHDDMRGHEGAFDSALEGIKRLRDEGGKIAINCVLSRLNPGSVVKMAELAKDLDVKLAFDPMEVFPGINDEYVLPGLDLRHLFREISDLKKAGYPVINSFDYLRHLTSSRKYSCAQSKIFLNVAENGEVTPFWCQRAGNVIGDLREQSLSDVLHSTTYDDFNKTTEGCSLCNNSSTVETSMFYSMETFLRNCFKLPSPILSFIVDYGI